MLYKFIVNDVINIKKPIHKESAFKIDWLVNIKFTLQENLQMF